MNLDHHLLRGAFWSALATWGRIVITLATFVIVARILGPEAFGIGAIILAVLAICEAFIGVSVFDSLAQIRVLKAEHSVAMFWAALAICVALFGIIVTVSPFLAVLFDQQILSDLIPWALCAPFLLAASAVPHALLRRDLRFKPIAVATVLSEFGASLALLILVLAGQGVWSFVGMHIARAAIKLLVTWFAAGWRPSGIPEWHYFRELMHFNINMVQINLLIALERAMPAFFIGPILGTASLGQFSIARQFVGLSTDTLLTPMRTVCMPAFARLQKDSESIARLFSAVARLSGAYATPAFVGIALSAPSFVPLTLGEQYADSIVLIQILALIGVRKSISWFNSELFRGLGYPDVQRRIVLMRVILVGALLLPATTFGVGAAAIAFLLADLATWPLSLHHARRLTALGIYTQLKPVVTPVSASLAMAVCTVAWQILGPAMSSHAMMFASTVVVGVASYLFAILAIDRTVIHGALQILKQVGRPDPSSYLDPT